MPTPPPTPPDESLEDLKAKRSRLVTETMQMNSMSFKDAYQYVWRTYPELFAKIEKLHKATLPASGGPHPKFKY